MATMPTKAALIVITTITILLLSFHVRFVISSTFTISNNCPQTIWPATLSGAGTPQLATTGLGLNPGQTIQFTAPQGWSGRIWARTECEFNDAGIGNCETGDCGGMLKCNGFGPLPPATLFEITLGKGDGDDFYDVSVVDGYNLPMTVAPRVVTTNSSCVATGCIADLNTGCPRELQVKGNGRNGIGVVACKSACEAFGLEQYCCNGNSANPTTCQPSFYASLFKSACPRAYSYAFDDATSIFTCKASDYDITFCPTINGLRKSNGIPINQSTQNQDTGDKHEQMASSANALIFPRFFSLIFLILSLIVIHKF